MSGLQLMKLPSPESQGFLRRPQTVLGMALALTARPQVYLLPTYLEQIRRLEGLEVRTL